MDAPKNQPGRWSAARGYALVCAAALAAYFPALRAGFIWDDDGHVTKPGLRGLHGLWRIWSEVGATQQFYPVLHSAFWVEHRLWGDAALGYHLLNVLLHATAACLLVAALRRLRDGAADRGPWDAPLIAGLLFALHPVCAESVAWISEQKNTLSAVFYLLAGIAYLDWEGRRPASRCYAASLLLFAAALLSKSVTATLPAALLVVLWWRRGSLSWRDARPLVPFFAIGIFSGLFTAWVERTYIIGAEAASFDLSLVQRCLLAGRVISFYAGKLLWPANLLFMYPRWRIDAGEGWQYLFPIGVLGLLLALWAIRGRSRGPLAAALFFGGTLFPALGFFNAYPFVFSYVADHFQYLACMGAMAAAAFGWEQIAQFSARKSVAFHGGAKRSRHFSLLITNFYFPILVLCALGALTWRQCGIYRDSETLYRATLAGNPDATMARNNLGKLLRESGRVRESIAQYLALIRLRPDAEAHYNLGVALLSAGSPSDAILEFSESLRKRPDYPEAHINLALALSRVGRLDEAAAQDRQALLLRPDPSEARRPDEATLRLNASEAHDGLGNIYLAQGRVPEAIGEFTAALGARANFPAAENGLGAALSKSGRNADAILHFGRALAIDPDYIGARVNLAIALAGEGRLDEAIASFRAALRAQPALPAVHFDLGNALLQAGRPSEAAAEFNEALRLKPDFSQARARLEQVERASSH